MEKKPNLKDFVEREFDESIPGEYDEAGFFNTPNGSFWDPDGVYFNREGFDKHGGYYDDNNEYIPGEGWDEANNCYLDEIDDYDDDEYGSDHDYEEDDGFCDVDMDNIQDEELLIKNMEGIERENPNKYAHNFEKEVEYLPKQNNEEKKEYKKEDKKEEIKDGKKEDKKENKKEDKKEEDNKEKKKVNPLTTLFDEMEQEKKKENQKKTKPKKAKDSKKVKKEKDGNNNKKEEDKK